MRISDWSSDVCSSDLPAFFGTKPDLVIKGGMIVHAMMGDPNASIPTPQPVHARPMFASYGRAIGASCISFVSAAAIEDGIVQRLRPDRLVLPVRNTRGLGTAQMTLTDALPALPVEPHRKRSGQGKSVSVR